MKTTFLGGDMRKLLIFYFSFVMFLFSSTVDKYVKELHQLTKEQSNIMALSYWAGKPDNFGLTLMAIVWKESSFGVHTSNSKDGGYGSFGIAQILLETAMRRLHVDIRNRKSLKLKLLTDPVFNLHLAIQELNYWKRIYKHERKSKFWYTLTLASYNAGWKNVTNPKGKAYAEDVINRIRALRKYFQYTKVFNHKVSREHLKDIQEDLRRSKLIR